MESYKMYIYNVNIKYSDAYIAVQEETVLPLNPCSVLLKHHLLSWATKCSALEFALLRYLDLNGLQEIQWPVQSSDANPA